MLKFLLLVLVLTGGAVGFFFCYFYPEKVVDVALDVSSWYYKGDYLKIETFKYHLFYLFDMSNTMAFISYYLRPIKETNFQQIDINTQTTFSFSLSKGNLYIPSIYIPKHLPLETIPSPLVTSLFLDIEIVCFRNTTSSNLVFQCGKTYQKPRNHNSKDSASVFPLIKMNAGVLVGKHVPSFIDSNTPLESLFLYASFGPMDQPKEEVDSFYKNPSEILLLSALHPYFNVMQKNKIEIFNTVVSVVSLEENYPWNSTLCYLNHTHPFVPCEPNTPQQEEDNCLFSN